MSETSDLLQKTFSELKSHKTLTVSVTFVSLTILIIYGQDLMILANEILQNEALTHIALVPFLAGFMIYQKRKFVKASLAIDGLGSKQESISLSEITGIALCISAFLLYWYGSYTFYPLEYHVTSLVIFIVGAGRMLLDSETLKTLIFPIMFLIFLIPLPFSVISTAGGALGNFNTQTSYELLRLVGVPVSLSSEFGPPTIEINNSPSSPTRFGIDISCSGIYSLIAFAMFATFIAYMARGSIMRKFALLCVGFLLLPILNILRITLTVLIAYRVGEATAMTIFHTFSGWLLIFAGMLLMLITSEKLLHIRIFEGTRNLAPCTECDDSSKSDEVFCSSCGSYLKNHRTSLPKRFWIKMTALLLVSYLVMLSLQAPVFVLAQGLTISNPNPEAGANAFPLISGYKLQFLYRDQDFEKISHQDASLVYAYLSQNLSGPTIYVLIGVADSIASLHSWETCLYTWQTAHGYESLINVLESKELQIAQGPPITARYFVFQHPANYTQVTLYWYQSALFNTGLTIEPKYVRISLVILREINENYSDLEQDLLITAQAIASYWAPLETQSAASLSIPALQALLIFTLSFIVILRVTQYTKDSRRKITNLGIFHKLASSEEKLVYQAIRELNKKTRETTTRNIALDLKETANINIRPSALVEILKNLEKQGIINQGIVGIWGQPESVWKP